MKCIHQTKSESILYTSLNFMWFTKSGDLKKKFTLINYLKKIYNLDKG